MKKDRKANQTIKQLGNIGPAIFDDLSRKGVIKKIGQLKERTIHIRVSTKDYIELQKKATDQQMTVSELMRLQIYKLIGKI